MEDSFVFFSFVLINLLDLNLPLLHILTRENNKIGWIKLQIILRSQTMNLSLLFIRILYQFLRRRSKSNNIDSFLIDSHKVLRAQQCSIAWTFPKLKALVSVHQWLATFVIQIEDKNCVNVDENSFIAYNYFFVATFAIFENIDVTIVNIQLSWPLDNKLINSFLLIWIVAFKTKDEEAKFSV